MRQMDKIVWFGLALAVLVVIQVGSADVIYSYGFETDPLNFGWTSFGGTMTLTPNYQHQSYGRDHSVLLMSQYSATPGTTRGIQRTISLPAGIENLRVDVLFTVNTNKATDIACIIDLGGGKTVEFAHQPWSSCMLLLNPGAVRPEPSFSFPAYVYYHAIVEIGVTDTVFRLFDEQDNVVTSRTLSGVSVSDVGSSFVLTLQNITQSGGTTAQTFIDNVTVTTGPGNAAAPVFTPDEIVISVPTDITITSATPGATIYYTTDGTVPTTQSTLYTGPVTVGSGTQLKAIAVADGYEASTVTSQTFWLSTDISMPSTIPIVAWNGIPSEMATLAKFNELRDAGFTHNLEWHYHYYEDFQTALDNALEAGIRLFLKPVGPVDRFVSMFKKHPALEGYLLEDEPWIDEFDSLVAPFEELQSLDADHWCYLNLGPYYSEWSGWENLSYAVDYVDAFLNAVPVEVLSFDHYPITTSGIRSSYYENLEIISAAAKEAGIPFWGFALSTAHLSYPVPTLTHFRFQMFSNLIYGAQGLQYFTYWLPYEVGMDYHDAPIDADGQRTGTWYVVQSVNQEIENLSGVFLGSEVLRVGHTGVSIPSGTASYTPSWPVTNLTATGSDGAVVSELINGQDRYLVVLNRDIEDSMSLSMSVNTDRILSEVHKDGTVEALTSGLVQRSVDPADIVILKWGPILGDANQDDAVNINDLTILHANYGTTSGATWSMGDFNDDGAVNAIDLQIIEHNYGLGVSGSVDFDADYATIFGITAVIYSNVFETDPLNDGWTSFGGTMTLTPNYQHYYWQEDEYRSVLLMSQYSATPGTTRGIQRTITVPTGMENLKVDLLFTVNTNKATDMNCIIDLGGGKTVEFIHQPWESCMLLLKPGYVRPEPDFSFPAYVYYHGVVEIGDTDTSFSVVDEEGNVLSSCTLSGVTISDVGSSFVLTLQNVTQPGGTTAQTFIDSVTVVSRAAVPGDANLDKAVDVADLGILAANYGSTEGMSWSEGDFNGDGAVDVADLGILAANYGTGTSGADWDADYTKAFGETAWDEDSDSSGAFCGGMGLPLIAGLFLVGLMLVKLEE